MIRWLLRLVGAMLLGAACCLPALSQDAKFKPPVLKPATPPDQSPTAADEGSVPVPEFAVAFLITALILTVVCMPSRKR